MTIDLQENIGLAPLTTLKIGGAARYFVQAKNEDEIAEAMSFASGESLPVFVLGGGSNILVSDEGFDGLVIQVSLKGIETIGESVTAQAGEDWDPFVAYCVENDLAGIECMSGIPGLVGGTPVQNVGAYGQEVAETITDVRCFDRTHGEVVTLANSDCGFTYRTSIFNATERERYVVLAVTYALTPGGKPKLAYKELAEEFAGKTPSLREVREAVLRIRRSKSMVIDPADPNSRSAGSFFKNPIVARERLAEIESLVGKVPYFEFGNDVKIPAAWLIEKAGFPKGYVLGNAGISSNHTLAIINRGDAKASDIIQLKNAIQETVADRFGIALLPEPVFVGF